jgi:mono/diheme cytochrome c family protein
MKSKLTREHIDKLVILVRGFRGGGQHITDEHAGPESAQSGDQLQRESELSRRDASAGRLDSSLGHARTDLARAAFRRRGPVPAVFQRYCVRCHGPDGDGAAMRANFRSIPDFTSRAWQEQHSASRLETSILEGRGSAMPPFSGKIDEPSATELVAFVRSLAGMAPAERQSSGDGFDDRFQRLMTELETLKREYQRLSSTADPRAGALTGGSTGQATAKEERMARGAGKL